MSREFGHYYAPGYFHTKLDNAAEDAEKGNWPQTVAMAPVLLGLARAAYVCSPIEASDRSSSPVNYAEWRDGMLAARASIDAALEVPVRFDAEASP